MANPQPDKYTKVSNELLEALAMVRLTSSEGQLFYAIVRKTYGWHKRADEISISQLEEMTGLSRRSVIYGIQNLEAKKMIEIQRKRGRGIKSEINRLQIQKDYDLWVVQGKSSQYEKALKQQRLRYDKMKEPGDGVVQGFSSARNGDLVVQGNAKNDQFLAPTKDIKIITKEKVKVTFDDLTIKHPESYKIYQLFYNNIENQNGRVMPKTDTEKSKIITVINQCHDIEKYPYWQIADIVIHFLHDEFWCDNFKSLNKLRRKNKEDIRYIDFFHSKMTEKIALEPPDDENEYLDNLINQSMEF